MNDYFFSENPLWEKTAITLAEMVFGQDWKASVLQRRLPGKSIISLGNWTLQWAGEPGRTFQVETTFNGSHENINAETPAFQKYDINGQMISRKFINSGILQNPKYGTAGLEEYYPTGAVRTRKFCRRDGELTDMADGSPAQIKYYENGNIQETRRRVDTDYGEPAMVFYSEGGEIIGGATSPRPAIGSGALDARETEARLEKGKRQRLAQLCSDETLIVVGKSNMAPVVDISNGRGK